MRPSRFNDAEIQQSIAQVGAGTPLVTMCRQLGVTQTTFYRWRRKFAGDGGGSGAHETRGLRAENVRLKQLVAELCLERQLLREELSKPARAVRRARD